MDRQQRQAVLAAHTYLRAKQEQREQRRAILDCALFIVCTAIVLCMAFLPNSYN